MSLISRETAVVETLARLSQLERLSDIHESIFAPLVSGFDAESMVVFRQRMDGPQHCLRPVAALNQTRDVLSHYMQKISPLDPSMPYWRSVAYNAQSVWSYSDVLRAAKTRSPMRFSRFLNERANVSHMLMMSLNIGGDGNDSLLFALHRGPGRNDFSTEERQTANNFAPMMRQVCRGLASADLETYAASFAQSVMERPSGAVQALVDLHATFICGDTAAQTILQDMPVSQIQSLRRDLNALQERSLKNGLNATPVTLGHYAQREITALPSAHSAKRFILTIETASSGEVHAFSALTPRQREVAGLVAKGCRNWQVAKLLGISENTVGNHLAAIYDTLAIGGRIELALLWKNRQRLH